eukprot:4288345-Prymnesium_polylepis.1
MPCTTPHPLTSADPEEKVPHNETGPGGGSGLVTPPEPSGAPLDPWDPLGPPWGGPEGLGSP